MPSLKELRLKAELTQKALAERVGVSERTIIHWEMGDVLPSFEGLQKLNGTLGPEVFSAFQANRIYEKRGRKPNPGYQKEEQEE
jgi:DNA-binding XRE family transcriptional regulator